jgi:hypothetical protein
MIGPGEGMGIFSAFASGSSGKPEARGYFSAQARIWPALWRCPIG